MLVLHLVSHLTVSGATSVLAAVATGLRARGIEARAAWYLGADDLAGRLVAAGVGVHPLAAARGGAGRLGRVAIELRLARLLRRLRPDLLQTWSFDADLVGLRAARLAGGPPVLADVQSHSYLDWVHGRPGRYRSAGPRFAAAVCASRFLSDALGGTGLFPPERLRVIPNAPGPAFEAPADPAEASRLRAALGLSPSDFVLGMVANFHPVKGHDVLLDAFARVAREAPGARLLVAGGDDGDPARAAFRRDLEGRIAGLGLMGRVILAGPRRDVPLLMAAIDVLAVPSRMEGLGVVIPEAMARGKPVVGSRTGGIPEAIEDEVTGILVPPGDPEALASALRRLVRDPAEAARMGRAGLGRFRDRFRTATLLDGYERLYREVMASPR